MRWPRVAWNGMEWSVGTVFRVPAAVMGSVDTGGAVLDSSRGGRHAFLFFLLSSHEWECMVWSFGTYIDRQGKARQGKTHLSCIGDGAGAFH